jgi:hypothetical protein
MGPRIHRWTAWVWATWLVAAAPLACAADLAPLRAQLRLPDEQVDYAAAKLVIDRLIDPSTDTAAVRRELDRWEFRKRCQIHLLRKQGAGSTSRLPGVGASAFV